MNGGARASIVVNNYNYGRFLREAVDSALAQTLAGTEVVVVDDGSTDGSREVIAGYGARVTAVLKENGGQASALNAGFAASHGDVVIFLDADDVLLPTAAATALSLFDSTRVAKAHWPLWIMDAQGRRTRRVYPGKDLPHGDLRELVAAAGPSNVLSPPTSGNAWSRAYLERVLPIPEEEFRICADNYLFELAPAFGLLRRSRQPQGYYRLHGTSHYANLPFEEKVRKGVATYDQQCRVLERAFREAGVEVDRQAWERSSWFHRLRSAVGEVLETVPEGAVLVLLDETQWGCGPELSGRRILPMDPPSGDATAIAGLDRVRREGAGFLVVAWPAFWWLDHYPGLARHLRATFPLVRDNERVRIFDLREEREAS